MATRSRYSSAENTSKDSSCRVIPPTPWYFSWRGWLQELSVQYSWLPSDKYSDKRIKPIIDNKLISHSSLSAFIINHQLVQLNRRLTICYSGNEDIPRFYRTTTGQSMESTSSRSNYLKIIFSQGWAKTPDKNFSLACGDAQMLRPFLLVIPRRS